MLKTICLLFVLVASNAFAQELYSVVKVVGKVENGRLGRPVKTGDKIESKDPLRFNSPGAHLIIISPKTGRKIIQGVPDNAPREIFQLLQSFVKPEERSTASRSTAMAYLEELGNTLTYDTLVILGDGQIPINTIDLPLKAPASIKGFYRSGSKTIYRKLSDDKSFSLNKSMLFGEIQSPFPKVALMYYKDGNDDPIFEPGTPIATFVPVYIDENELKDEVGVISLMLGDAPSKTLIKEVKGYIVSEYGGVQDQNLYDWLKKNINLKE